MLMLLFLYYVGDEGGYRALEGNFNGSSEGQDWAVFGQEKDMWIVLWKNIGDINNRH